MSKILNEKYEEACEYLRARGIDQFNMQNGIKNTEPEPQCYPFRPFKAGDIVELISCNGRVPLYLRKYIGTTQVVECDEDNNGIVGIVGDIEAVPAVFLVLVTPAEEMEPFSVGGSIDGCVIYKKGEYYAEFVNSSEAERACKLLNAEWRKETHE